MSRADPRTPLIVALPRLALRCCRSTCAAGGNHFLLILFTRILILAIAAASLNLILGYGGMVSFGHAAYLGIGGYAVGILAQGRHQSGFVQWPVALARLGAVRARRSARCRCARAASISS